MSKLDDASWHLHGENFPEKLPEEFAATHIGFFVNWAIDRGLWGQFLAGPVIEALAQGQLAGRDFVMQECDGKLVSAMLNEEGAAFAEKYYDAYLKDYQQVLVKDLSSDYPVDDNAANRNKIAALLDQRFANWKQRAWWKFW